MGELVAAASVVEPPNPDNPVAAPIADFKRVGDLPPVSEDGPSSGPRAWLATLKKRLPVRTARPSRNGDQPASPPREEAVPDTAAASVRDFNPVVETAPLAQASSEIFAEIGQELRLRREMLSLTYEEIERHTHVRTAFLAALERGDLMELSSPVQTRGILVNYATFLDLDADAILLRFADAVQAQYREKGPLKPARTKAPMPVHSTLPPLRAFIASDLLFGGGLAIMLLLFAIWGINRVMAVRSQAAPAVTPPSISDVLVGTALPTLEQQVTVIPAQDTAVAGVVLITPTIELATLNPNVKVQVKLASSERTYLRVMVDGKLQFEGRTDVGGTYTYEAGSQIEVVVGNAAALRVTYNTQDLGLMGNFGEVIDRLYTAQGIATPTATPRPTGTPTPRVTTTLTPSLTVTPSLTPTP